jgi:hypothetical protein
MEHRWGERYAVQMRVELSCGSSPPVTGSLENVSSSGAFVRTEGRRPPRGPVEVILGDRSSGRGHSLRLPAYVVRETEAGVGIEWCEFAPRVVRELMLRDRHVGSTRARAPARDTSRQSLCGPNTAMQPFVQPAAAPAATGTYTLPVAASAATECA